MQFGIEPSQLTKAAEEIAIRQTFKELQKNPPCVFVPKHNFDPAFERDTRFFATFIAFQLHINKNATIDDKDYYKSLKFNEMEQNAIRRWTSLYAEVSAKEKMLKPASINPKSVDSKALTSIEKSSQELFYKRLKEAEANLKKKAREKESAASQDSAIDDWGRTKRPRLHDDGNSWREQN